MNQKEILRLIEVSKIYSMGEIKVEALKKVSFDVLEGEILVILGASGSGKSTVLHLIGGMDKATSGEIYLHDKPLTDASNQELTEYRRSRVGFVFQYYNLLADLTAYENVELAAKLSKNPFDIEDLFQEVELSDKIDHLPSQLSGGQQQRVAIARALVKRPDILLCDEPTGSLDYNTGKTILVLLEKVARKFGTTVIMVTHNNAFTQMADRVINMRSGEIVKITKNDNPIKAADINW